MPSGEKFDGQSRQRLSYLSTMIRGTIGGVKVQLSAVEFGGGRIMLWGCFATGGTGTLHKVDGIGSNLDVPAGQ